MSLTERLNKAYARKTYLAEIALPSHRDYGLMTEDQWLEEWRELEGLIYALEATLDGQDRLATERRTAILP